MSSETLVHVAVWVTVVCLICSPLCFAFARLRWGRPWLLAWAFWTIVGFWTTTSDSAPARALASLWYGDPLRVRDMIFPIYVVLAVAGACAIGICLQVVIAKARQGVELPAALPAAMALLLVVSLVAIATRPEARRDLEHRLGRVTMTNAAYPRVFAWLDQNTPRGEVVAYNRNIEFIPWMLDNSDVGELFGIFSIDPATHQDQLDRVHAWAFLVDGPGATPAGCLVAKYKIRYVVVGSRKDPAKHPDIYRHDNIGTSPYLRLIHQDGPLRVFEVTDQGRNCPTSS